MAREALARPLAGGTFEGPAGQAGAEGGAEQRSQAEEVGQREEAALSHDEARRPGHRAAWARSRVAHSERAASRNPGYPQEPPGLHAPLQRLHLLLRYYSRTTASSGDPGADAGAPVQTAVSDVCRRGALKGSAMEVSHLQPRASVLVLVGKAHTEEQPTIRFRHRECQGQALTSQPPQA